MSGSFTSSEIWLLVTATPKEAKPDSPSELEMVATCTSLLVSVSVQPAAGRPAITGGVLSMLIPLTVADAVFPARSWQLPLTCWFAPSAVRPVGAGGLSEARPESASEQAKLTATFVLFQPFAFAEGVREPLIEGGVLSILIGNVCASSTLPAKSLAKKSRLAIPSLLIVAMAAFPATLVLGIGCPPVA